MTTTTKPGVIATIVTILLDADETKKPVTRKELVAKLVKRFPKRKVIALQRTVNAQLGQRLATGQGVDLDIWETEAGTAYSARK